MLLNTSETIDSKAVWFQCGMKQDLSFLISSQAQAQS